MGLLVLKKITVLVLIQEFGIILELVLKKERNGWGKKLYTHAKDCSVSSKCADPLYYLIPPQYYF